MQFDDYMLKVFFEEDAEVEHAAPGDDEGVAPFFAPGAGGMLQTVLSGFAGLRITDQGLVQGEPQLPPHWTGLKVMGIGDGRNGFWNEGK